MLASLHIAEFERWMHNVTLIDSTLEHNLVLTDRTSRLENLFEERSMLKAEFVMQIFCFECSSEQAFASEYPASFGRLTSQSADRVGKISM